MRKKESSALKIIILAVIITSLLSLTPASALTADFDWTMYRIDTSEWYGYPEYEEYSGIIYKVEFKDQSSGATRWDWDLGEGWDINREQNPVHIYTKPDQYTVKLTVMDNSGNYDVSEQKFFADDDWGFYTRITPEPTQPPTPVPTAATPTPVPTQIPTPTPEPTPAASHVIELPGISGELNKLQTCSTDYIGLIKEIFRKTGILKD